MPMPEILSTQETSLQHLKLNDLSLQSGEPIITLVANLQTIFQNIALFRGLLACKGQEAQNLLDVFQFLLDTPRLETNFRRKLIVATQRISTKTGLYPACYELKDVSQEGQFPIASGGFADIYKGDFQGQVVCMKTLRLYRHSDIEHMLKQFSKEVILWGQLIHPNVLPIYGLYRYHGRLCLVAPWMKHDNINTYLKENPAAPRPRLALDVASGLLYLHENGVIHGDLKGPNILIDDSGVACVADFGISSVSDSDILAWTSHSSLGSKGGSVRWQAPELFDMDNDAIVKNTVQSDVYAWACVCYEIFTGLVPFITLPRDAAVIFQVKLGVRPARPGESSPSWAEWGLSEKIWSLIETCWKEDPAQRPAVQHIVQTLMLELKQDTILSVGKNVLSPARFRDRMSGPVDITSILLILDLLLHDPVANQDKMVPGVAPVGDGLNSGIVTSYDPLALNSTHIPGSKENSSSPEQKGMKLPTLAIGGQSRSASPTLLLSPPASPPLSRYRGWLTEVITLIDEFIDKAVDPRDFYLNLRHIGDGRSGSISAAKLTDKDIHKLKLPPHVKTRDADDLANGRTTVVAIRSVAVLPRGSPHLDDLKSELTLMSGLWHENVLSMDAVYVDLVDDSLWIRMELMDLSLADIIRIVPLGLVLEDRAIARFMSDLLQALVYLHMQHIAHRDVRSGNLFINKQGILKLSNFANAVKVKQDSPMSSDLVGVSYWQAPEIRAQPYNALKADIWSLGATAWELAEAKPPFVGSRPSQQLANRWPPLSNPQHHSPAYHNFLHLCSNPEFSRPTPSELLKHPFIQTFACERPVIVQLISQYIAILSSYS